MAMAFGSEGEIQVQSRISNDMTMALTPGGDIFLGFITSTGSAGANPGSIKVAHGKIGTWKFTQYNIHTDTGSPHCLSWGNYTYYNINFSRSGPGVAFTYTIPTGTPRSKSYDNKLYIRHWTGQGFTPQSTLFSGPTNAVIRFHLGRYVMDNGQGMMLPFTMHMYNTANPPQLVGYAHTMLHQSGHFVAYGKACETSAKKLPLIEASHYPYIGNSGYALGLRNAVGGSGAVCLVGTSMTAMGSLTLPFDLSPLGITGCQLHTDILISAGIATGSGGTATFPFPVPSSTVLKGLAVTSQWAFIDSQAPGGLRFTGGGVTYPW
jgi:hypothetical protein